MLFYAWGTGVQGCLEVYRVVPIEGRLPRCALGVEGRFRLDLGNESDGLHICMLGVMQSGASCVWG